MATPEQRARRRAQRETAKAVKARQPRLQSITRSARQGRIDYANRVIAGTEPMPEKGTREANNLASLAGKARHGKADPRFEKAFAHFWYHKNDESKDASETEEVADNEAREDTDGTGD